MGRHFMRARHGDRSSSSIAPAPPKPPLERHLPQSVRLSPAHRDNRQVQWAIPVGKTAEACKRDVAVQCSHPWSCHGIKVQTNNSANLMARFERCVGGLETMIENERLPTAEKQSSKAVQANVPWVTNQIRMAAANVGTSWLSPYAVQEDERRLEQRIDFGLGTCTCTLVHVCALACFQPNVRKDTSLHSVFRIEPDLIRVSQKPNV